MTAPMNLAVHPASRDFMPMREALILSALLDHPWLAVECRQRVESLRFTHPDAAGLCCAIERAPAETIETPEALLTSLKGYPGAHRIVGQVRAIVTPAGRWGADAEASKDEVRAMFRQLAAGDPVQIRSRP